MRWLRVCHAHWEMWGLGYCRPLSDSHVSMLGPTPLQPQVATQAQRRTFWSLQDSSGLRTGLILTVLEAESIIRGGQSWHPQWHRETLTSSMFRKQHSVVTDWVTSFTGNGTAKAQGQRAAQWMPGRRGELASGCLWVITSLELDRCAGCATHASISMLFCVLSMAQMAHFTKRVNLPPQSPISQIGPQNPGLWVSKRGQGEATRKTSPALPP